MACTRAGWTPEQNRSEMTMSASALNSVFWVSSTEFVAQPASGTGMKR
jgi:hypothetical protein